MSYELNGMAADIWAKKYKADSDTTIEDMWRRTAKAMSSVEQDKEYWENEFYQLQYDFKFIPGGRINAGAGTLNNYLLNCAVLPVEDSIDGIYEAIKRSAVMAKCNYGIGFDFSSLRPKGDIVSKGGVSSGPVSFMRVFDTSGAIIETGGGRRAAAIGILRVDHPDILEFIDAKRQEGVLTQFNISVGITDEFINAVKNNEDFDLSFKGKVYKTVKAKEIWDKLVKSGYNYNDPGIFYIDQVNKCNNGYYLYDIAASNPCGEIPLPPYGVCDLGNINLTKFVVDPFTPVLRGTSYKDEWSYNFNWASYEDTIKTAVRFLDNVLDVSDYPYKEIADRAKGDRRIGLNGVAGLGSFLAMLRVPYDSAEAIEIAKILQEFTMRTAYNASVELAKEKGAFANFDAEKYTKAVFILKHFTDYELLDEIYDYGIRNIALLTIPPVGTGSLIAGNISNGLEPIFALEYNRNVRQLDGTTKQEPVEDYAWKLYKQANNTGDTTLPTSFFKTSREISPKAHVDMQAALQEFIDGSISKTANIPESFTIKEYEELLWYALDKGCKGFTTFREGTREGVLETKKEKPKVQQEEKIKSVEPKKKRPRALDGKTYKLKDDLGNLYVTINDIEERGKTKPFEIFINSNGENSQYAPWYRAMGKLMSAVMRRTDDCSFMVKDLQSIYGQHGFFSDGTYVQSQPQMVGNVLREHLDSLNPDVKKEVKHLKCPECGEMSYVKEGGCSKCLSCSYSTCG